MLSNKLWTLLLNLASLIKHSISAIWMTSATFWKVLQAYCILLLCCTNSPFNTSRGCAWHITSTLLKLTLAFSSISASPSCMLFLFNNLLLHTYNMVQTLSKVLEAKGVNTRSHVLTGILPTSVCLMLLLPWRVPNSLTNAYSSHLAQTSPPPNFPNFTSVKAAYSHSVLSQDSVQVLSSWQ